MIVSETTRFGKLQGICHLNTPYFAYFNPPLTSQRSNILVSGNPDGLLRVPLVGRTAHAEPHNLRTWLRRKPVVKFLTTLFLRNKPYLKFSLQVFAAGFAFVFRLPFSPAFFAYLFRLRFSLEFSLQFSLGFSRSSCWACCCM